MSRLAARDEALLQWTAEVVFSRVDPGGSLDSLPEAWRVFARVYSAQGVIDNGGFQYFFESDWPGCPDYRQFSAAYREIGMGEVADWLEEAAAGFPFADPHRDRAARVRHLREFCVEGDSAMGLLSDRAIEASDGVFGALAAYVRAHRREFADRRWWSPKVWWWAWRSR